MGACLFAALVTVLVAASPAYAASPNLVISQVYGGGGNTGAQYSNDFIEIFNRGDSTVFLNGVSLQYTSATGTGLFGTPSNQITEFTSGSLAAGQYLLVQEASGGAIGVALAPDVTDLTPINMGATGGKVALVSGTASLGCNGGSTPCSVAQRARIIDLIGYDGANFSEGSPAPALTNTTAALRANGGCADSDDNSVDFTAAAPAPRNLLSPITFCTDTDPTPPSGQGQASPTVVLQGGIETVAVKVTPGARPTSTGLAVSADLTQIGGSATQQLYDDRTHGDLVANDNQFTFSATVDPATAPGSKVLLATITDAEGRSGTALVSFSVIAAADQAPAVSATMPANAATSVPVGSNVSITFTEPVSVSGSWFTISCGTSGSHAAAIGGGPTTFTFDPTTDFATGETCTVTIVAADVTDQDTSDPPDQMAANYAFSFTTEAPPVAIHDIQGAAHRSPYVNQTVTGVNGIVTAKRSNGYYMQDPNPDASDATSEGIFVFTGSAPNSVNVGDAVSVNARVQEFRPGGSSSTNLATTELTSPVTTVLSSGSVLPPVTVIGVGGRIPPNQTIEDDATGDVETSGVFDPAQDGLDFWESMEGMRVGLSNAVAVGPTSSFGETPVVGDDGANAGIRTARGGVLLRPDDGNPERLILDDSIVAPEVANVGDHYPGSTVGVLDYNFGNFMLEVTSVLPVVHDGVTPESTTPAGASEVAVATFNFENLDPSDPPEKFARLAGILVDNLKSPDIVSGEEVQDDNGPTNDSVVDANVTLNTLVAAIEAAGGPHYDYRYINPVDDQDGGEPGGNIRQVFLFRTDRGVSFVDRPGGGSTTATAVLNGANGPELSASPGRIDPASSAFNASRKPLAGEFTYHGQHLFVIANHFNSKGGDQPLEGHFQPPTRSSEVQRHQQAQIVHDFVAQIMASDPNANVVVDGDLNDFQFSDTVSILKGTILSDLVDSLPENQRYSYVFEGNSQTLDHILLSGSLSALPFVYDIVHVNSEFADQASDHEPSVVRIPLNSPPTVAAGGPYAATEGASTQLSATGTDPDGDAITYAWDLDGNGTFETPGQTVTYAAADGPMTPTVKVRATDSHGHSAADSATVAIANLPPTITALVPTPSNGLVGEPVTFTGTATDPSSVDASAGFGWAVNTGSGFGPFGGNPFAVTYSACGTYTVDAKARDKDGGVSNPFTSTPVRLYDAALVAPLTGGAFNLVQGGRTIPFKITIGCNGFLSGLHPAISIRAGDYDPSVDPADPSYDVPDSSSAADTSGVMRESGGQYVYNLGLPATAPSGQLFTVLVRPFGGSAPTLFAILKVK